MSFRGKITPLSEPVLIREFGKTAKLMLQFKLSKGEEMVDIRTWTIWPLDGKWHSNTNGLFIERSELMASMDKINQLIIKGA